MRNLTVAALGALVLLRAPNAGSDQKAQAAPQLTFQISPNPALMDDRIISLLWDLDPAHAELIGMRGMPYLSSRGAILGGPTFTSLLVR